MADAEIRKNADGLYVLAIAGSRAEDLVHLLDPDVPLVHVSRHFPVSEIKWWTTQVPLSAGVSRATRIRHLSYDLEMTTAEFLKEIEAFKSHGLDVYQLHKSLPSSCVVEYLPREQRSSTLLGLGMESHFQLPHRGEVSVFASRSDKMIRNAMAHPEIADRWIGERG